MKGKLNYSFDGRKQIQSSFLKNLSVSAKEKNLSVSAKEKNLSVSGKEKNLSVNPKEKNSFLDILKRLSEERKCK